MTLHMLFLGPPVIMPLRTPIDVGVGSNVSIACIVQGYPPPVVQWGRLLGTPLPSNSYVIDNNLTIIGIALSSQGIYQCTATNDCDGVCGTAVVSTTISVHGM